MTGHSDGFGFFIIAVLFLVHWIPTVIAFARGHHQKVAILALNFFLGWSGLGWIGALIWSLTAVQKPQTHQSSASG